MSIQSDNMNERTPLMVERSSSRRVSSASDESHGSSGRLQQLQSDYVGSLPANERRPESSKASVARSVPSSASSRVHRNSSRQSLSHEAFDQLRSVASASGALVDENDEEISVRVPILPDRSLQRSNEPQVNRQRYYQKLDPQANSTFARIPNHCVPSAFIASYFRDKVTGKISSPVFIFLVWFLMMGTSQLAIPWGIQQAGFALGIAIIVVMSMLATYTATLVLKSAMRLPNYVAGMEVDFSDVVALYLGRYGRVACMGSSGFALLAGMVVYWILMSNFLLHGVIFIHNLIYLQNSTSSHGSANSTDGYICLPPHEPSAAHNNSLLWTAPTQHPDSLFDKIWQPHFVPLFLTPIIFLVNFKSGDVFAKFNMLGVGSFIFLLAFIMYKAALWGIHMEVDPPTIPEIPMFKTTFFALSGICCLAFFLHNCILNVASSHAKPEHVIRDTWIAYALVTASYLVIGIVYYISYACDKATIADNLMNNFASSDTFAAVARICICFQMMMVYPCIMFLLRTQFYVARFGSATDSYSLKSSVLFSSSIIAVCVLFAIFLPQIGLVIRFAGGFCGLVHVFSLPCLVTMQQERAAGTLTRGRTAWLTGIIVIGVVNLAGQFLLLWIEA